MTDTECDERPLMMKELPAAERPREKLCQHGAKALTNAELLAILLRTGTKQDSVMRLAERLLKRYEEIGIAGVAALPMQELSRMKGIGPTKAVTVLAALELGKRLAMQQSRERPVIQRPEDAAALMGPMLRYEPQEHFKLVLLSTKHHVLAMPTVSVGTLNASLVHPREVFRMAVAYPAAAIILVHNHPSGDPTPSQEDIALTKRLAAAGELMDIRVLDHIIIGDNKYVSLKEKGII